MGPVGRFVEQKGIGEMETTLKKDEKPAAAEDDFPDVLCLQDKNFDVNVVKDATFVMFYAPWCKHCKSLKPIWIKLSKTDFSAATTIPVKIAYVDAMRTRNKELLTKYRVRGVPTMLLFFEGTPEFPYTGEEAKEALFDYVITKLKRKETKPEARPAAQVKN